MSIPRRHRASISNIFIPMPPPETHSPIHIVPSPTITDTNVNTSTNTDTNNTAQQNCLTVSPITINRSSADHDRHSSQVQLFSSSAPSMGSFLTATRFATAERASNSTSNARRESVPNSSVISSSSSSSSSNSSILTIEFEGGNNIILRPNRIYRGKVIMKLAEPMHITRIRVKFRAEESAMVKIDEGGADGRGEWIHEMITTFFETEWKLYGQESSPYSQSAWEEIEAGNYEYPFALKFPNVNYPPSMEEPAGFGIRFIWTAQADGPALQSGLKSREFITSYRPIIVSLAEKEWVYKTTLMKDKKQALAEVQAKIDKQTYCPDEVFKMILNMTVLHSDSKITNISYRFRKHHEGKMLIQQGTAYKEHVRIVLQDTLQLTSSTSTQISESLKFKIPTRLVSPSFISRHTRVYYDLHFQVTIEQGHIFKTSHITEFTVPIVIANLPNMQIARIPDLTSIINYRNSYESPLFFDPSLNEPPRPQAFPSELIGPLTAALMTPNSEDQPPSYFSLPELPPQFELRKERKERTVFMSRPARGAYNGNELGEATIIPGLYDEDW
ncbi:uncharacterized protein BX663DRAFT_505957 [Cokeromyces recurvatus]|uniref:uncharacterized protein n=1 Tax=Cokeromyces recurvatus TaxID=90255 RepID=UPI00221FD36E|nr:uncharacterized protein BX663DRAFT_505957 [Cokeromyces recurvatus]KAI7903975.1 hypothetical protein BX663DRAFT_505957 [Cokeromyces recurvatus]